MVIRQKGESQNGCFKKTKHARSKKCSFFRQFAVPCFLETSVLRFALLSYYWRNIVVSWRHDEYNCFWQIIDWREISKPYCQPVHTTSYLPLSGICRQKTENWAFCNKICTKNVFHVNNKTTFWTRWTILRLDCCWNTGMQWHKGGNWHIVGTSKQLLNFYSKVHTFYE